MIAADDMRILVVEDEPDLLSSLAKALREEGYAVDTAEDGQDGLFKAESWAYDAIVLDVMLPRLDGCAAVTVDHDQARTEPRIPRLPENKKSDGWPVRADPQIFE